MRYFLDTEFIENGQTIDLISIGIVSQDNRKIYIINNSCEFSKANDFVKENVIPNMFIEGCNWVLPHNKIKEKVMEFVGSDKRPEFWAYYADYDWIAVCQLFGTMMDLPENWPMYCRDIKQWLDFCGNPYIPSNNDNHNALEDAEWVKSTYGWLVQNYGEPVFALKKTVEQTNKEIEETISTLKSKVKRLEEEKARLQEQIIILGLKPKSHEEKQREAAQKYLDELGLGMKQSVLNNSWGIPVQEVPGNINTIITKVQEFPAKKLFDKNDY